MNEYAQIPEHMLVSITHYVLHGQPVGGFLTGIITNDLGMAVGHADAENRQLIATYYRFFYNRTPSECFGSMKAKVEWEKKKGAVGQGWVRQDSDKYALNRWLVSAKG